MAGETFFRIQL